MNDLFHLWFPLGIVAIAIAVAQWAWRLTRRAQNDSAWHPPRQNIRGACMEVNEEFERIFMERGLADPLLVNCGTWPNDGTGDRIEVGMAKIRDNLIRLFPKE